MKEIFLIFFLEIRNLQSQKLPKQWQHIKLLLFNWKFGKTPWTGRLSTKLSNILFELFARLWDDFRGLVYFYDLLALILTKNKNSTIWLFCKPLTYGFLSLSSPIFNTVLLFPLPIGVRSSKSKICSLYISMKDTHIANLTLPWGSTLIVVESATRNLSSSAISEAKIQYWTKS